MELKEALLKRRSVRKFTNDRVSDEAISELLHAAMSGPSACNKKPWEFYVVKSREAVERLRQTTAFSKMEAPIAIVVCANLDKAMPGGFQPFWVQDTSAATENILLRVTDLGLGACWCGIHPVKRSEDRVKEALDLPKNIVPLNIIWIGHPGEDPEPRDQYDEQTVHYI